MLHWLSCLCLYWCINWVIKVFHLTGLYFKIEQKTHRYGRYIKTNHMSQSTGINGNFLWSVRAYCMNCSKYLKYSSCVNQKASFHLNWLSQLYNAMWTLTLRTLQPMLRTLHCVNYYKMHTINQLFGIVGHIFLDI